MKYDKPLIAMLIGVIVVIPLEFLTQIFKHLNITTISIFEFTSMMFIWEGNWLIGALSTPVVGALATFTLYHLTKIIGTDFLLFKGAIIGMFTWAIIDVIFGTLGKNNNIDQPILGHFAHASGAALAGVIAGFLMNKYLFNRQKPLYEN